MSVLMPNASLGLRRRADAEQLNSHGERVLAGFGALDGDGLLDGLVEEQADGTFVLGVDPALWPVRVGDMVLSEVGQSWTIVTSDLLENSFDDTVSWVRCTALRMHPDGATEPGGAWFVARFEDTVDPEVPPNPGVPTWSRPGVWTGHGLPPDSIPGARTGDEYIDLTTGVVYELR